MALSLERDELAGSDWRSNEAMIPGVLRNPVIADAPLQRKKPVRAKLAAEGIDIHDADQYLGQTVSMRAARQRASALRAGYRDETACGREQYAG